MVGEEKERDALNASSESSDSPPPPPQNHARYKCELMLVYFRPILRPFLGQPHLPRSPRALE